MSLRKTLKNLGRVRCVDCGMLSFHIDTNDYREIYMSQRGEMREHDILFRPQDHEGVLACYQDVYDVRASVGTPGDSYAWVGLPALTRLRRCRKFIRHVQGRLPSDLVIERRIGRERLRTTVTMVAAIVAALAATVGVGLAHFSNNAN